MGDKSIVASSVVFLVTKQTLVTVTRVVPFLQAMDYEWEGSF
jgi:hypothetical protein